LYYDGKDGKRSNLEIIIKVVDFFICLSSEIYYNKFKSEKINDCRTGESKVHKDGI
jgi:hypothetical protein